MASLRRFERPLDSHDRGRARVGEGAMLVVAVRARLVLDATCTRTFRGNRARPVVRRSRHGPSAEVRCGHRHDQRDHDHRGVHECSGTSFQLDRSDLVLVCNSELLSEYVI